MMYHFHNLPIRRKLTLIVHLTSVALVFLMAIFFISDKLISFRRNMVVDVTMLAQVIGMNSAAALVINDQETAEEILSAMSAEPNVAAACIFKPSGQKFVSYPSRLDENYPNISIATKLIAQIKNSSDPNTEAYTFVKKQLILAKPIILNNKQIGYIVICAKLNQLYNRLMVSGLMVLGVMVVLIVVAKVVTTRLHRTILKPLLMLVTAMDRVTADENYSLRVQKQSRDELGDLMDGFNAMLAHLQQMDQQLEEQVAQRNQELVRSHEKLKQEIEERKQMQEQLTRAQRMEAVGTLAAGVAHDLNNILSGIVSYPDLLLIRLPEDSDLRKPLKTIQNSGQKAAAIVQDMLTLARRGVTISEVVNLKRIIQDYLESPEHKKLITFNPEVSVINSFDIELMNISGSPFHLGKTIMNLISNAAESIQGDGTITISLRNQYIDAPIRGYDEVQQGDYVLLEIKDTGHGIAAQDLERIFEPFFTKKRMGRSGTGLGMAVVWSTVKDHRGYIDVESSEGNGTVFSLYFPATRREHAAQKPVALSTYLGSGQSILVVDDIKEQREIASDILKSLNYTVHTVNSGEAAIEYLQNHRADLLLLDMIMVPGIDGFETYRRIITQGIKQRAIIASGYSESERVKQTQALGAGAYLRKPYTIENLARAVYNELHDMHDLAD